MQSILFITDGSILSPILNSQGLPLLNFLGKKGVRTIIYSFEQRTIDLTYSNKIKAVKNKFPNVIYYYTNEIQKTFIPSWILSIFISIKTINRIIEEHEIGIVHCRSLFPALIGFYFKLIKRKKIKFLYDNRGVRIQEEIFMGRWKEKSLKVYLLSWFEKKFLGFSDSIVVVSSFFKSYLISTYKNLKLESNKINIIPNRTFINKIQNNAFQNKDEKPIVVFSGSAARWQSLNEIEAVFKSAQQVFKSINFRILTYHPEGFKNIFNESPALKKNISIREVAPENVFNELIVCHFGLLLRENNIINKVASPLKFAEYLSAGLTVLISEGVGDTEEIIKKHKIGVIIRNHDYNSALMEMKIMVNDPKIFYRCRKAAETEFDIEDTFTQYLKIYEDLWSNRINI